ncbi:deoxyxylulose-5-phosphate synthase [Ammonifex degensii KC4]|uniref:1-deoxy-D-xylulose-5-phosphate synthase n=1 Tax=Ammonifex degensii (strain DSM 10501 / KC4) TaxID=429009 RepID=C9R871_AMMDK|nr:1-deoxy-D-xylulose-5-phosphate synthase [Ammonifex degensii]ACX52500.1 deoxyxylulose-5-phosphate synthase [Ammonifex degensii KC4]
MLARVNTPEDLKALSLAELEELAAELREFIINTVAHTGGHLAPNLGVVELTLALYRVFDFPRDKIIWDVGHQCYVHKIITGRKERFGTLRQLGGVSGFPSREESPYDIFGTGHASTSISAALGLAKARDLAGDHYAVVAVIGDGALTGGMALEALNHAGHLQTDLIVVLNDNEMSISKNVGALANYLSRLRSDPAYRRLQEEFESLTSRLPGFGPRLRDFLSRLKGSVKYLVVPGMFFEELGFTYLGPVDGHHLPTLLRILERARALKGPVLVHVVTRKGKGYKPAEEDPDLYHGVGPFNPETGELYSSSLPTYTEIFGRTLVRLAEEDPRIVAITAAMPSGTGLKLFAQRFPHRFFDVGIAEQHAVTFAAGLAVGGYRPVVAIYSTFLQRAYDQIIHDVCLQRLPVVFALDRAGIVGEDGATHQGLFDLAYLRSIPHMVVMAPADENELQHMLKTALTHEGPIALRYPRGTGLGVTLDADPRPLPIGQGVVLREGRDVTLIAIGNMVPRALKAAEELAAQGISAAVINARFVKPLDIELILRYAKRTRWVVTIEEGILAGGFGSAVAECLTSHGLGEVKITRLGIEDTFVEHGHPEELRKKYGLDVQGIVRAVLQSRPLLRLTSRKTL